jgi:hypothetical protein
MRQILSVSYWTKQKDALFYHITGDFIFFIFLFGGEVNVQT